MFKIPDGKLTILPTIRKVRPFHYANSPPLPCNLPNPIQVRFLPVKNAKTGEWMSLQIRETTVKKWEEQVGAPIEKWKNITIIMDNDGLSIEVSNGKGSKLPSMQTTEEDG